MIKRRQLVTSTAKKQLLRTLTDSAALPALVRQMPAPTLKRLIDHVGLRDSGALIALTSPVQMREIFEEALWQNLVPGQAERLQPGKFMEWLDVMLDVGASFTAERLMELGETFVVLNLAPLIRVTDRSADIFMAPEEATEAFTDFLHSSAADGSMEEFGGYFVSPVHEDEWESIRTVLAELESSYGDFLERTISRCCHQPTALGFVDDGQPLLEDETYEREQRRAAKGFVTPHIAAAFLSAARKGDLDALCDQHAYDDISARYFERLAAAAATSATTLDDSAEPDDSTAADPTAIHALEQALVDAQIISNEPPKLLTGPADNLEQMLELQMCLDRLQFSQPHVFSARLGELVFLANILMAGSWYQGARFNEAESAQAALAVATSAWITWRPSRAGTIAQISLPRRSRKYPASCGCFRWVGTSCNRFQCTPHDRCSQHCAPMKCARVSSTSNGCSQK
ncbi:MAG: hypothetical protein HC809_11895 [Gammaproteobacteria bacterium]|nr:hypothetical protein [Gammaproteobacteria bacterium]